LNASQYYSEGGRPEETGEDQRVVVLGEDCRGGRLEQEEAAQISDRA